YPFKIGKTWGKYCVRLYTDKECSKTSKEIEISNPNNTNLKNNTKEQDFDLLFNNIIIQNNIIFKGKKLA
ncbi:TPA: hypothetical protein RTH13_001715, partial [Campylobacter jejuni]|nr:hypothetical protein [Campylobacter jejuni]